MHAKIKTSITKHKKRLKLSIHEIFTCKWRFCNALTVKRGESLLLRVGFAFAGKNKQEP